MLYYLSLGANLGQKEQTLQTAVQMIEQQIGHVLRCSSFYYSAPWGFRSENDFCNLCCSVECDWSPIEVLQKTQAIEIALGRVKPTDLQPKSASLENVSYTDRPIDIDLIRAFDKQGQEIICQLPTLPHPLWEKREFVTVPLAEIMC